MLPSLPKIRIRDIEICGKNRSSSSAPPSIPANSSPPKGQAYSQRGPPRADLPRLTYMWVCMDRRGTGYYDSLKVDQFLAHQLRHTFYWMQFDPSGVHFDESASKLSLWPDMEQFILLIRLDYDLVRRQEIVEEEQVRLPECFRLEAHFQKSMTERNERVKAAKEGGREAEKEEMKQSST
ncbi:MAG: hypothetical protein LQ340_006095 [Diploschistes diacapsis]|nr:MAG: hypothetical protein LQ340_006095 [Diploschistes diacapsis]